jgi:hypothetical protein
MDPRDFEIFKLAFQYVQEHRFTHVRQSVSTLHLVGEDGNIDPDFRTMLVSVYGAIQQGFTAVNEAFPPRD